MKRSFVARTALLTLSITGGTACSTIKGWFPDKERDYQFTTEIPELIVPDDLKTKILAKPAVSTVTQSPTAVTAVEPVVESQPVAAAKPAEATKKPPAEAVASKPLQREADTAKPAEQASGKQVAPATEGYSSLQIDQDVKQSWRLVGRALSRGHVEVVERNLDKTYFYVKYDPDAINPEDGSLWDEVTFLFADDPRNELEYRVNLEAVKPLVTEVTIENGSGQKLSGNAATSLLRLITDGISHDTGQ